MYSCKKVILGPFTRVVKESIHVKNPGTEPVIFKVKTTAPKQYCVRPNAGRIEPNSEIEVQSKFMITQQEKKKKKKKAKEN